MGLWLREWVILLSVGLVLCSVVVAGSMMHGAEIRARTSVVV